MQLAELRELSSFLQKRKKAANSLHPQLQALTSKYLMTQSQCPICYSELEVKDATPCFVCGCWHEGEELEKFLAAEEYAEYALPDDSKVVLCKICYLEDILANQGDILDKLSIRKEEANASFRYLGDINSKLGKDKYCRDCNKRLSLLKVISNHVSNR